MATLREKLIGKTLDGKQFSVFQAYTSEFGIRYCRFDRKFSGANVSVTILFRHEDRDYFRKVFQACGF